MNFDQLNLVLKIAQCGSLSAAAKQLFISQPTVSKMLKSVEDELGFELFERSKSGITPTLSGKLFLEYSRETLDKLRHIKAERSAVIEAGRHSLNAVTNGADFLKECFLRTVSENSAETDIFSYLVANLSDCFSAVSGSISGLGILYFPSTGERSMTEYARANGMEYEILGTLPMRLAVAKDSPLLASGTNSVSLGELADYRISYPHEDNSFFSNVMFEAAALFGCKKAAYCPRLYGDEEFLRCSTASFVPDPFNLQLFAYSDWIRNIHSREEFRCVPDSRAVMRKLGCRQNEPEGIRYLGVYEPPFAFTVMAIRRSTGSMHRMERLYLDMLRGAIKSTEENVK